jgi:hypothetical protein
MGLTEGGHVMRACPRHQSLGKMTERMCNPTQYSTNLLVYACLIPGRMARVASLIMLAVTKFL